MAYDYSPEFLARNADEVKKILRIAQSGEIIKYTADSHREIAGKQYTMNNVLAGIARNLPEYSDIRKLVRTWIVYEAGRYDLYVGKPMHRITGRPTIGQAAKWVGMYLPAAQAGNLYSHADLVEDEDALTKFVGIIMSLPGHVQKAEARIAALSDESYDYFHNIFYPYGWSVKIDGDKLVLERITA